ncbi:MAG: 50S ribosomal protein L22 [bacterium]|nr:50S ribosomal protein L22 [bacterium]
MKAYLKNYRQTPRKVRIIGNLVKGKSVAQALGELTFLVKRGSEPLKKLLESAVANAKNNDGIEAKDLFIKSVTVNGGMVMKRVERKARGASNVIHKRSSNITVELTTNKETDNKKQVTSNKEEKKISKVNSKK